MALFGKFDENIKMIEESLNVQVTARGNELKVKGQDEAVDAACKLIYRLLEMLEHGEMITPQNIMYVMNLINVGEEEKIKSILSDVVLITFRGKHIKCKTIGQKNYVNAIKNNDIVFGIGPAGTGKTYLAMAMAIAAFKNREVNRIILTRPAVEAGEKLGFLPGDLQDKVDPYLRPLYDALHDMLGYDTFNKYIEKGLIEVAPLAYMRGRTLDDAFIILDEAQNTTPEQMKMFLTRIGFGSKAVITGDVTQIDLPKDKESGLVTVMDILEGIKGISFVYLTERDVVRHPLVQKIIQAYNEYDKRNKGNYSVKANR
ncbi:PhoH family protein [Caldanaerobius polysaccharolyticus]|uniref:PhoH family protein n=1 Tax=Caldanaerobius polysaccharolyticus TaxID=44256 RepID=UPI000689F5CB|nr:PhoH family protein [Caldanaerobius polysaccharolyticus]